jgi:hypothetical protein
MGDGGREGIARQRGQVAAFRSEPKSLAGANTIKPEVPVQLGIAAALAFLDGS